jgi:hypothetical protein
MMRKSTGRYRHGEERDAMSDVACEKAILMHGSLFFLAQSINVHDARFSPNALSNLIQYGIDSFHLTMMPMFAVVKLSRTLLNCTGVVIMQFLQYTYGINHIL